MAAEAQAMADVRARVLALQRPGEAQEAALWLQRFQRSGASVPLCAALLQDALKTGDSAVAFFAAQTIAERARMPSSAGSLQGVWQPLVAHVIATLRAGAAGEAKLPAAALRQLATALGRLAVWLEADVWADPVGDLLALPRGPDAAPLAEVLRALVEEVLDRRLPVRPSQRVQAISALRSRTCDVMQALGQLASSRPSALVLQVAAAWLRAQLAFEEWLPMISFSTGTHAALCSVAPVVPLAARSAGLELDLEAFKAASDVFEASLALTTDLGSDQAAGVVLPVLSAFGASITKLPADVQPGPNFAELLDIYGTLAAVMHTTFTSVAMLRCEAVWAGMVKLGTELLVVAGPSGRLMQHSDGALLDSVLDAWEGMASTYNRSKDDGLLDDSAHTHAGMASAFSGLVGTLPAALTLPQGLQGAVPEDWELPKLRSRASRALLAWCGCDEPRVAAVMQELHKMLARLPPPGTPLGAKWVELESTLWFAASAAQVFYRSSVRSDGANPVPELLAQLLMSLPRLPRAETSPAQWALISGAAADFVCAVDPWITPALVPPASESGTALLVFLFEIAGEPGAPASTADALAVVLSNLAPALAADAALGSQVLGRTAAMSLGTGMPVARQERLVQSALGPLLSLLPEAQLDAALEELMAALRHAAPPAGDASDVAVRLLFTVIAAPKPSNPEPQLRWFTAHWLWFEAALTKWVASEAVAGAACEALTTVLSRSWACPGVPEVLHRAVPLLAEATTKHRSAPALTALSALVRLFHGGPKGDVAALLARHTLSVLDALLAGGPPQVSQLPSDLLESLPELLAAALAPGSSALAVLLLQQQCVLSAVVVALAAILPNLTSPQAACWSLRACAQLPHWLQRPESQVAAAGVLQAALPGLAGAWCRLVAVSPVVRDPEVMAALAKAFLGTARVAPGPVRLATGQALAEIEVEADKQEILLLRLGDPSTTEEGLAEVLRDSVDSWQALSVRRLLCSC